jgi:hypothetical protein
MIRHLLDDFGGPMSQSSLVMNTVRYFTNHHLPTN